METNTMSWSPSSDSEVKLFLFHWVCQRPFVDPLGLNDTQVVAAGPVEAQEYLLDQGGWRNRDGIEKKLRETYEVLQEQGAPPFHGTWREWTQAVHHGLYPRDLVRLPETALTQARMDASVVPPLPPKRPRRSLMRSLDGFLNRQAQYRRAWKLVGIVLGVLVAGGVLFLIWQALVLLVVSYVVIRAVAAGMSR